MSKWVKDHFLEKKVINGGSRITQLGLKMTKYGYLFPVYVFDA